jgi:hypothetical protein
VASDDLRVDRKASEEIAATLEAEDLAEGMKIIGDWPY